MGSSTNVWILGGYQSDFSRNLDPGGPDFADLTAEVVDNTLDAAGVDAAAIDVVHVANAFGELFARPGPPRRDARQRARRAVGHTGRPGTRPPARRAASRRWPRSPTCGPAPTTPHWWSASSWRRPCRATPPPSTSARPPGSATRVPTRSSCGRICSPEVADEYDRRYGLDETHLRAIAQLNFANARAQPQRADPRLDRARSALDR